MDRFHGCASTWQCHWYCCFRIYPSRISGKWTGRSSTGPTPLPLCWQHISKTGELPVRPCPLPFAEICGFSTSPTLLPYVCGRRWWLYFLPSPVIQLYVVHRFCDVRDDPDTDTDLAHGIAVTVLVLKRMLMVMMQVVVEGPVARMLRSRFPSSTPKFHLWTPLSLTLDSFLMQQSRSCVFYISGGSVLLPVWKKKDLSWCLENIQIFLENKIYPTILTIMKKYNDF